LSDDEVDFNAKIASFLERREQSRDEYADTIRGIVMCEDVVSEYMGSLCETAVQIASCARDASVDDLLNAAVGPSVEVQGDEYWSAPYSVQDDHLAVEIDSDSGAE